MHTSRGAQRSRTLTGTVVSNKMKDTAVVLVERFVKHPRYHKSRRISRRVKVHDAGNSRQVGEKVTIVSCRPISRDKRFRVFKETGSKCA